jgi:hypothetical protein
MATTANGALLEQLIQLTEAVKQLAERPSPTPAVRDPQTDADRVRQRVAFGYQVLGALTGRVSSATGNEFDVPVVEAIRKPGVIYFNGLPPRANWVELRAGSKVEVLRIRDVDHNGNGHSPTPAESADDERSSLGKVEPQGFADTDRIGSVVFLRTREGPLVAFGSRLEPLPTAVTALDRVSEKD